VAIKTLFIYLSFCLFLFAEEPKANLKIKHEWQVHYPRFVTWENPIHFKRILPVPEMKLKDTIDRLKDEPFISINQEEARWFLNNNEFNASNILAELIAISMSLSFKSPSYKA
jgi:hypothetical protein